MTLIPSSITLNSMKTPNYKREKAKKNLRGLKIQLNHSLRLILRHGKAIRGKY